MSVLKFAIFFLCSSPFLQRTHSTFHYATLGSDKLDHLSRASSKIKEQDREKCRLRPFFCTISAIVNSKYKHQLTKEISSFHTRHCLSQQLKLFVHQHPIATKFFCTIIHKVFCNNGFTMNNRKCNLNY